MANQLAMDKSFAINDLRAGGYSQRRIAETLGVSRGAVRRHLQRQTSNSTNAPPASAAQSPTEFGASNSTKASTGSGDAAAAVEAADLPPSGGNQFGRLSRECQRHLQFSVILTLCSKNSER